MIKFLDIYKQDKELHLSILNDFKRIFKKGDFILGNDVKNFEKNFSKFCNSKFSIGLSHNESSEIVELFFEEILQCFEKGEEVKLTSFGTFKIREKKERIGRNPKTGVEAKISSRKVVTFKPSSYIKEKIIKKK